MLKLLAVLFMFIDHMAIVFFEDYDIIYYLLRSIGRLAMPLFAYGIALGFLHTHDIKKYALRLLGLTLIAQIPWAYFNYGIFSLEKLISHWNIGLTLLCGLLFLYHYKEKNIFQMLLCLCLSLIGEYGPYTLFMMILFYHYLKGELKLHHLILPMILLTAVFYPPMFYLEVFMLQIWAIGSLLIIFLFKDSKQTILPKSFFYSFYPVHLMVLALIREFLLSYFL